MAFTSPSFILFIVAVVLLTSALPTPGGRSLVLLGANVVFIASYVDTAVQLAPLAAFLLLCYLAIEGVRRSRAAWSLAIGIGLVLASFIVLKKFSFLGDALKLPFAYLIVGLSYIVFRVLHLMIDAKQGELARPVTPLHFFNYTCNFLSFTAGPIQRYPEYLAQTGQPLALDEAKVFGAFARVIRGFLKVGVVSAIFNYLFANLSARLLDASLVPATPLFGALLVATACCYTVYLYANFAGYMDIVIGVGTLMGQQIPENFDEPFRSRSFLEFWSRWHMTLSDWFKTYLFNPLLALLARRVTASGASPYLGVVAFFVTFLVMGVWHGTTAVFVVYGLLMGAGASVNKLWQVAMARRLGKKRYKALCDRPVAIYVARGLTFAYFALALTCLWVDMPQLLSLTQRIGLAGLFGCWLALALAAAAVFFAWDSLVALCAPLRDGLGRLTGGVVARNGILAAQVLAIATVGSFFHRAPEFVYRAF